jgi:uncharacterized protein YecT (DUF1311 family)
MIDAATQRALDAADAELNAAYQDSIRSAWGDPAEHAAAQRRFEEAQSAREKVYAAALAVCAAEVEESDIILRRLDRGRCRHPKS